MSLHGNNEMHNPPLQLNASPLSYHQNPIPQSASPDTISPSLSQLSMFPMYSFPIDSSSPREGSFQPSEAPNRYNTDTPLEFSAMIQSSPQLIPISGQGFLGRLVRGRDSLVEYKTGQSVKREASIGNDCGSNAERANGRNLDREVADGFADARMASNIFDGMNPSPTEDKDVNSMVSGTKKYSGDTSDIEVESSMKGNNANIIRGEGMKRSFVGDMAPTSRHFRSISMDSFMGNLNLFTEPSSVHPTGQCSPSNSLDGNSSKSNLDFGNCEFSEAEMKKIMENEKLAELALSDPKRAKRILANRQSAARSKERKMRYISELEHKVQSLLTETSMLSSQVTALQREYSALTSQNNELKFRVQAMKQQAELRDALNEALTAEVQRMKLAITEEGRPSGNTAQQSSMSHHQMFSTRNPPQLKMYELDQNLQLQNQMETAVKQEFSQ